MGRQAPNIYEQQAANKRNTVIVMVAFTLFVGFLGYGCDAFLFGTNGMLPIVTILALVVGGVSAFSGLQSGSKVVLASAGAQPAAADNPQYRQLHNVVDEMAIASGQPRPNVYVIPDPDPNAFATGKDPAHASIAVTDGLIAKLTRDELQGVIAHEMSHIRNYDIRMMTVVAALAGAVMLLTEFGSRSMRFGGRRRSSGRGGGAGRILLLGLWLFALVLAPLVSQILAMAVSRQREYLADASSAELTRHPLALAAALEKIDGAIEPTRAIKKGTAHLCIADPLGRHINEKEGAFSNLFATRPPIAKRIIQLKAMAYQHM